VWVRCATVTAASQVQAVCGADIAGPAQLIGTPLMVVDPTDGTVLARQVLPAGTLWAVSAGRLVIATPVTDDESRTHWEVRATDPTTGATAWQDDTPSVQAINRPVRNGIATIDTLATLTSDADRVLLATVGYAWAWSRDGDRGQTETVSADGSTELGRSGTLVWTSFHGLAAPAGVLVTARGEHVAVQGIQAELSVDDGSAPEVVLLRTSAGGTTLVARDARSGKELWRSEGNTGPILVMDGAVVTADPSGVVARDARTGHQRWRDRVDATPVYLGADPLHVVVMTDALELRVLDLADGRVAVTADVGSLVRGGSDTLQDAAEHGGRLLVSFRDGAGLALG